jgi:uncharacterized protein YndB with AHSA1/START domain
MTKHAVVHATFTLERTYPVPRERVFQGWATQLAKARWFAGGTADYRLDFRAGGTERNSVVLDGKHITWESLYREIVADERIVYTSVLLEEATIATVSITTVELVPEVGGARLVLVESGAYLDGRKQLTWREQGTGEWLDALGRFLAEDRP